MNVPTQGDVNEMDRLRKIMAGDLYSVRDNLERIITFIGIIASNVGAGLFGKLEKNQVVTSVTMEKETL